MSEPERVLYSPLGKATAYINRYDSSLLYPIARDINWKRQNIDRKTLPFRGVDVWNAYELSWLNSRGKPVVALAEFRVPATSTHIIESKSLKLYLNSFNLTRFSSDKEVISHLTQDLSKAAGGQVEVKVYSAKDRVEIGSFAGHCIDDLDINIEHYEPAPQLLTVGNEITHEVLVSHLLKSNCPVTGQPDWASIQVRYQGPKIDARGLLGYLISYREHGDFHEQCVETIFMDIWNRCRPQKLSVYARYVRRGGLDINPYRSSLNDRPNNPRLARQ